jgi:hypothetical protein
MNPATLVAVDDTQDLLEAVLPADHVGDRCQPA